MITKYNKLIPPLYKLDKYFYNKKSNGEIGYL